MKLLSSMFAENRLIGFATLQSFGLTKKPVSTRGVTLSPRVDVKARTYVPTGTNVQQIQQTKSFNTVKNGASQAQMQTLALQRSTSGKVKAVQDLNAGRINNDEYNSRIEGLSRSQASARRLLGTFGQPISNAQKAQTYDMASAAKINDEYGRRLAASVEQYKSSDNPDAYAAENWREQALSELSAERDRKNNLNEDQAVRLGKAKTGNNPARTTQSGGTTTSGRQPFGARTSAIGIAANKTGVAPTRAQRLGLAPMTQSGGTTSGGSSTTTPGGSKTTPQTQTGAIKPITPTTDVPTETYDTPTNRMAEAAGALDSDDVEAPGSLREIVDEEMAALDPAMAAQKKIRDAFKIYTNAATDQIDKRGADIEAYKQESTGRSEAVADLKISQSKSNRDLQLELINDARERSRRDQLLAEEKTDRDYDREEDRIITENTDKIERLNTALGARYGGFGSGKGLKKIEGARQEAQKVLRELNEDRIYARQVDQNKLTDIEDKWSNDRKLAFSQHDTNVTAAYTKMVEEAQKIDDKVLDEEGDQTTAAIALLKDSFTQLDKIWTKTGDDLAAANRRALDRRDAVRKESYDHSQDAFKNMFSALSQLPSNSPIFTMFEKAAGLSPGTIGATKTNEERRIAISQGQLSIQQRQLQIDIAKFERDGNQIDHNVSNDVGYLVTSTGDVFRDSFGNPVYLGGAGGSVTSNIGNDRKLFGDATVGMNTTTSFSNYALSIGDLVPGSPYHKGGEYDVDGLAGTPIPAWTSGTVQKVNNNPNDPYGLYVDVFDGQNTVRYAHLQSVNVKQGQDVSGVNGGQRQLIGVMGNTGNTLGMNGQAPAPGDMETGSHLHLEVRSGSDFDKGARIDAMDVGMSPGTMVTGKVTWVDDMRKKMRQGMGGSELDTPWVEIDNQILELSKDVFRDKDGKTDWRAVNIVYDAMQSNKMGDYQLNYAGGLSDSQRESSQQNAFISGMSTRIKDRIESGDDAMDLYESTLEAGEVVYNGKKVPVDLTTLRAIFKKAGYEFEAGAWGNILPGGQPFNDRFSRLTAE